MRTHSTRSKVAIATIAFLLLAGVTTSCRMARVGTRCATTELGQDATHVLQCKSGRWRRIMTRQQAIDILVAIAKARATTQVAQVAVGDGFSCARLESKAVKCWGKGDVGQLGSGSATSWLTPVAVSGLENATFLATGQSHACAVVADDTVRCWGENTAGQLGDGTTTNRSAPVAVPGITDAVALGLGTSHSCALISNGGVKCWGDNTAGQLGDGTTTARNAPVQVSGLTAGVARIDAGATFTCARMVAGGAKCWGNNFFGMLGNGTPLPNGTNSPTPVDVSGVTAAFSVSAGTDHACASDFGVAKCWGLALNNRLGNNGTTDSSTPVVVPGVANAAQIDAGFTHSCILRGDGSVSCFGSNVNGELGTGTTQATGGAGPATVAGL